jgi:hypothetical protein
MLFGGHNIYMLLLQQKKTTSVLFQQKLKLSKRLVFYSLCLFIQTIHNDNTILCRSSQMLTNLLKNVPQHISITFSIFHCPAHT